MFSGILGKVKVDQTVFKVDIRGFKVDIRGFKVDLQKSLKSLKYFRHLFEIFRNL